MFKIVGGKGFRRFVLMSGMPTTEPYTGWSNVVNRQSAIKSRVIVALSARVYV